MMYHARRGFRFFARQAMQVGPAAFVTLTATYTNRDGLTLVDLKPTESHTNFPSELPPISTIVMPLKGTESALGEPIGPFLFSKSDDEFTALLSTNPDGESELNLSGHSLGLMLTRDLVIAFSDLSLVVTSLNLSSNRFEVKKGTEFAEILAALPDSVLSLNLSWNSLFKLGTQLALAIAAIPGGVTSLNLAGNYLGSKSVAELIVIFAALPENVTEIDLRRNSFFKKTDAEIAQIIAAMPETVTSIAFNEKGFMPRAICGVGVSKPGFLAVLIHKKISISEESPEPTVPVF